MRHWLQLQMASACGYCGHALPVGVPVFELAGPGWKKHRCESCAGEPVPQDIGRGKRLEFPQSLARPLANMVDDFKLKQAGER